MFVDQDPKLPSPEWLKSRFALATVPAGERRNLLVGRSIEGAAEGGAIICVCFQVGAKHIETAAGEGHTTVEGIGRRLGAGARCGSCISRNQTIDRIKGIRYQQRSILITANEPLGKWGKIRLKPDAVGVVVVGAEAVAVATVVAMVAAATTVGTAAIPTTGTAIPTVGEAWGFGSASNGVAPTIQAALLAGSSASVGCYRKLNLGVIE